MKPDSCDGASKICLLIVIEDTVTLQSPCKEMGGGDIPVDKYRYKCKMSFKPQKDMLSSK